MLKTLKGIRECDMMPFCQIFERSRQNGSLGEGFSLSTFRDKAERSILGLNNSETLRTAELYLDTEHSKDRNIATYRKSFPDGEILALGF